MRSPSLASQDSSPCEGELDSTWAFLQQVAVPLLVLDAQGRVFWLNEACEKLLGFACAELRGEPLGRRCAAAQARERVWAVLQRHQAASCTLKLRSKDGRAVRRGWTLRPTGCGEDGPGYWVMTGTESQQPGPAVDGDHWGQLLLRGLRHYGVFALDADGFVASWNGASEEVSGYRAEEIQGRHISVFYPQAAVLAGEPQQQLLAAAREGQVEQEAWWVRKGGSRYWAGLVMAAVHDDSGRVKGFTCLVRDLTEKRTREDMLRRLGKILDDSLNEIFVFDAATFRFLRVNKGACKNLGYTLAEMQTLTVLDIKPGFDRESFEALVAPLRAGAEEMLKFTTVHQRKDGSRYPVEAHLQLLESGTEPLFVAITLDLTERRRVESALFETQGRWQTLFEAAPEFIFLLDPGTRIKLVSPYACARSGYREEEFKGRAFRDFVKEECAEFLNGEFCALREGNISHGNVQFVCKGGEVLEMDCAAAAVRDETGDINSYVVFQRDISDRIRAQEEVQRHQQELAHVMRLSTMGEMASGMAHELNQPLAAVRTYCETAVLLLERLESPPPEVKDILERAAQQAYRAGDIIRHLRDFVSKGNNRRDAVDLDHLIENLVDFFGWELRRNNTSVELRLGGEGRTVLANKVQIEQVLLNLIRNSLEAIQSAGAETGRIIVQTWFTPPDGLEVTVTDNGPGIDAAVIDTLFEPFRTTKGSGMGIGLSISRSILEAHGGHLWAANAPGGGALFGFVLKVRGA